MPRRARGCGLPALLAIACVLPAACDSGRSPPGGPNVILVVVDTLRADRLGVYGRTPSLTPHIDAFAAGATVFERAYSHAPWTLPSMASLFTSRTPPDHGAGGRLGAFSVLPDDATTVAGEFADAGYATAAITNVLFLGPRFGAMRGFEQVDQMTARDNQLLRIAEATTATALAWIDRHADRPFFLLVHYFDPHLTYDPPSPFRERYAEAEDATDRHHVFGTVGEMVAFRRGELALAPDLIERLEHLYDGEVAYTDAQVGRLLAGLAQRGLLERSIVTLVADHGEEFGDHGGFEHGHTLYDELLHVPLVVRVPETLRRRTGGVEETEGVAPEGAGQPDRVAAIVRLIDVAPTLLELAGLPVPDAFTGSSLAPHWAGRSVGDRTVLSSGNMWGPSGAALRDGRYKIVVDAAGGHASLYDIDADSGEQADISDRSPDLTRRLRSELGAALEQARRGRGTSAAPELDERERDQLRSLGYGR